ncbi:MAG: DcrB-related protein [Solirubrobacterales bacterium]
MQTVKAGLAAEIPEDWVWKESLTLLEGGGKANVIFSTEPLDPSIDLEHYVSVQGELLEREFDGYRQMTLEPMRMMGGREGRLRRFVWHPPEGVEVTQIQLYSVEGSRGYTATATTPTSSFEELEPVLVDILQRLAIGGAPGVAAAAQAVPPGHLA